MNTSRNTFALYFGTRGFFPSSLIAKAREEIPAALRSWGYDSILMDAGATKTGGVETARDGQKFAEFLLQNRGKYSGVILSLPNFGDENGAIAALKEAGVPILIQAYPDEFGKMGVATRRDSFCGKVSIMNVFVQNDLPFTVLPPHTVNPTSDTFRKNVDYFNSVCSVVKGMRGMVVGGIGARTTPFKTVRIDETTLQRHGITVETLDLSTVITRVRGLSDDDKAVKEKAQFLKGYSNWNGVPETALTTQAKLGVVLDQIVDEYQMDAVAIRCWEEIQREIGVSPCVSMGALCDRLIPAACEVDLGNAVTMTLLSLASGKAPALLDWNNNYGEEPDKCILFHCGPLPASLMEEGGRITRQELLQTSVGQSVCTWGCNVGRIKPMEFTFGGLRTDAGRMKFYLGEGEFTNDPIDADFFGVAGVAKIDNLQQMMVRMGHAGHRHHVSVTPGKFVEPVREALTQYLKCDVMMPQHCGCDCR